MTDRPTGSLPRAAGGFTLLEVMIAVLIAMVGLIGTIAVQQTVMQATLNSTDQATAMRLAVQKMEEFATIQTLDSVNDWFKSTGTGGKQADVNYQAQGSGSPAWKPGDCSAASTSSEWVDAQGRPGSPVNTRTTAARFCRRWMIVDPGANLPYQLTAEVRFYLGDVDSTGAASFKTVRLDSERRKTW